MRHLSFLFSFLLLLSGCDSNNPTSSTRSLERLIVGTWGVPTTSFVIEEFEDWRHIIFSPDGTFSAPWGLAGPPLPEFKGNFWSNGNYVGTKGVGGAEGEGRTYVQFAHVELTQWTDPEALGLQVTQILPEYIVTLGYNDVDEMSSGDIQKALDKLNDRTLGSEAMGDVRVFQKVERQPQF
ncbi:MAG: hypothetical protein HN521_01995 [Candidatus Latescibacteria bacterium]|nr:hypothetical protein [Candidatus Latescibacterota bacterium]